MTIRVAVVISHPIQHFCPQYSSWSAVDGVDVKVFFASRHGLDAYEDKGFGRSIKWDQLVLDFPHEFLPGAAERTVGATTDCEALADHLKEFAPEVVVVYGYSQPLQRRAVKWAKTAAASLVMIADSELRGRRSWFRRVAKAIVLPRFLKNIDVFLSVGDANEAYYRRYGVLDQKLVRCSFPIDVKEFDAVSAKRVRVRANLRAELGIPEDHIVILMVGKLVPWKRQEDLVKFSNCSAEFGRAITVLLVGTGPDESMLRARAATIGPGGVLFAGFVLPAKLVEYYAAADVYAHCSEIEPHSLAISEAIYSGLPVVLSDRCGSYGPSDDVRIGLNGLAYSCGNVMQLTSALMEIIGRPSLLKSMGHASVEIAHANQNLAHGRALMQALEVISLNRRR